jgi:hypothetical protein
MTSMTEILGEFFPDEAEPIWLRSFDPKGLPSGVFGYPQKVETCIAELRASRVMQDRLKAINEKQGVYFVVNAGGNEDGDIARINAIYCEMDMDVEPDDTHIVKQHDMYDNLSPLMPSIRINTRKSVHAYWLPSEPITNDQFLDLQQGLIQCFKSDPAISNLSRVMRVPYFNHVRYEGGYKYQRISHHTFRPDLRYSLAELQEAFPYHRPKPVVFEHRKSGETETLEDVKAELRSRVMELPSWKAHGVWGSANGICHNGEGDTGLRVNFASGSVTCWSKCSLKQILDAFGLSLPSSRRFDFAPQKHQASDLYRWYQEQKKRK